MRFCWARERTLPERSAGRVDFRVFFGHKLGLRSDLGGVQGFAQQASALLPNNAVTSATTLRASCTILCKWSVIPPCPCTACLSVIGTQTEYQHLCALKFYCTQIDRSLKVEAMYIFLSQSCSMTPWRDLKKNDFNSLLAAFSIYCLHVYWLSEIFYKSLGCFLAQLLHLMFCGRPKDLLFGQVLHKARCFRGPMWEPHYLWPEQPQKMYQQIDTSFHKHVCWDEDLISAKGISQQVE